MTPKQAADFLYQWERRRQGGLGKVVMLGAAIGAACGAMFAVVMMAGSPGLSLNEEAFAPFLLAAAQALGPTAFLWLISLACFAGLGAFLAFCAWNMLEARYLALIAAGARAPSVKPVHTFKDRAGGLIVLGVAILVVIWLLAMVWREIQRGAL